MQMLCFNCASWIHCVWKRIYRSNFTFPQYCRLWITSVIYAVLCLNQTLFFFIPLALLAAVKYPVFICKWTLHKRKTVKFCEAFWRTLLKSKMSNNIYIIYYRHQYFDSDAMQQLFINGEGIGRAKRHLFWKALKVTVEKEHYLWQFLYNNVPWIKQNVISFSKCATCKSGWVHVLLSTRWG